MNESKKDLLRKVLIEGEINPLTYEKIKAEIFVECHLDKTQSRDRALWSTWINGRSVPNRFCQNQINFVLTRNQIKPIYD